MTTTSWSSACAEPKGPTAVLAALAAVHAAALGFRQLREHRLDANPLELRVESLVTGRPESLAVRAAGRPLLIVFWTTWCEYCSEELQRGAALADRLASGPAPVNVVFVNVREHRSAVASHPASRGIEHLVVLDPAGEVARGLGVRGYPYRVLLGARGQRLWTSEGLGGSIEREVFLRVDGEGPQR